MKAGALHDGADLDVGIRVHHFDRFNLDHSDPAKAREPESGEQVRTDSM